MRLAGLRRTAPHGSLWLPEPFLLERLSLRADFASYTYEKFHFCVDKCVLPSYTCRYIFVAKECGNYE